MPSLTRFMDKVRERGAPTPDTGDPVTARPGCRRAPTRWGLRALAAAAISVGLGLAAPARAEGPVTNCSPLSLADARLEARRLLDNAERSGDSRSKLGYLEAAYRIFQDPVILYNLGSWWYDNHKPVEAADFLRRYQHEAGSTVAAQREARIARMRNRAHGPFAELQVSGEPCAFVYVDGHLAGRLPLSLPLLLRPGRHTIDVERDHRRHQQTLNVHAGTASVTARLPAALVLLPEPLPQANLPGPLWERLSRAATVASALEGVTLISDKARDSILSRVPQLRTCLDTLDCQEELARQLQAQLVLTMKVELDQRDSVGTLISPTYQIQLLDATAGAVSVSQKSGCTACNADEAADRLSGVVREVLQKGLVRDKGTLEIVSVPEANVTVDGRPRGRTPYLREVLAGPHEIVLSAVGYDEHRARVVAQQHRKATLNVKLNVASALNPSLPVALAPPVYELRDERSPRPRWRLVSGGVMGLVGVGLMGLGGSALSIDGQCGPGAAAGESCPGGQRYATAAPGGAMLGVGAALLVGGVTMMFWPGERRVVRVPVNRRMAAASDGTAAGGAP